VQVPDNNPELAFRDAIVIVEIDGELHYTWLGVGEIWPWIVAPVDYRFGDFNYLFTMPTLLIVATHVASYTDVFLLTFENNNLQVYWLHPSYFRILDTPMTHRTG